LIPSGRPKGYDPNWPYPEKGQFTEVGGVRWHHLRLGSGPLLLLLHGSASSIHSWAGVASLLRSHFTLLIPDLPGHGRSSPLPSVRGGPDAWALALADFLEREGLQPDLVVGHSAGAVLAIRAVSRGWVRPRGILGVNPALGSRETFLPRAVEAPLVALAQSGASSAMAATLFRAIPLAEILLRSTGSKVTPAILRAYRRLLSDPGHVRGVLHLMSTWDPGGVGQEAAALGIPVHFLTGARDRWVPTSQIRALSAGLPLEVVPDRGHLLPEEDPGAVVRGIGTLAGAAGVPFGFEGR
jgi:magnesium chelatase accessory protein